MVRVAVCLSAAICVAVASDTDTTAVFRFSDYIPPAWVYRSLHISPGYRYDGSTFTESRYENAFGDYGDNFRSSFHTGSDLTLQANQSFSGWNRRNEWEVAGTANAGYTGRRRIQWEENVVAGDRSVRDRNYSAGTNVRISSTKYFTPSFFMHGIVNPGITVQMMNERASSEITHPGTNSGSFDEAIGHKTITERTNLNLTASGGIGMGRITDVTAAAVALAIVERSAAAAGEAPYTNPHDLYRFAQKVEKLFRRRVLDSRIALIENVDSVSRWLGENEFLQGISPRVTLEMADIWNHAFRQKRQSGFRIMISPEFVFDRTVLTRDITVSSCRNTTPALSEIDTGCEYADHYKTHEKEIAGRPTNRMTITAGYANPVTRDVQFFSGLSTGYGYQHIISGRKTTTLDYLRQSTFPLFTTELLVKLTWYPDLRTDLTIGPSVNYQREFDYRTLDIIKSAANRPGGMRHDFRNLTIGMNLRYSYYFSPHLNGWLSGGFSWEDRYSADGRSLTGVEVSGTSQEFSYRASTGFDWSIF